MISLTDHEFLECYHLKVAEKQLRKLEGIKTAVGVIDTDWDMDRKTRFILESRLAQDYYRALESALKEAEVIPEAEAEAEADED